MASIRSSRRLPLCALVTALWIVGSSLATHSVVAELKGPQANDRQIARAVTQLLKKEHLTGHPLDEEISGRCLKTFLKTLDPMKMYFLQSDVDEFKLQESQLGNLVRGGDVSFAYKVFQQKFLTRVDERVRLIQELLAAEHDFSVEEEMITDPLLMTYAANEDEIRDRWRKRIKYELLSQKAEKVADKEAREKLSRRYNSFAKRMRQISDDELLEMYLTALTSAYDPHTTYMSTSSLENFDIIMRLKLEGIGAALQFDDGNTIVSKLIPGGAAEKDGRIKPKDRVIGVGEGQDGPIVDVVDMSLNDVVKLIRGHRDTIVRLKVIPVGETESKEYAITRALIELKDSEARSEIIQEGSKSDGTPFKIGVIDLPSFYMDMAGARKGVAEFKSTTRDVRRLLDEFNKSKVDAVILDLRRNGGGSLTEAISLTGLFIDAGPIVQVKDKDGRVQHYDDPDEGTAWSGPLVVLTSKFSASASEIFAGAIQDYGRGIIVGDRSTHGKGTVQSLLDLGQKLIPVPNAPQLGALKITMQQFYRPNGDSTQNRGVLADIELPSLTSHLDVGESDLDYALKFDHVDPAPFNKANRVDRELVQNLAQQSTRRIDESEDFKKVTKNISRYLDQKKRKRVSLNETAFMADRAELNAEKEEEKELEENADPGQPVVKRNFYFNEALAVTLDYLRLSNKVAANN